MSTKTHARIRIASLERTIAVYTGRDQTAVADAFRHFARTQGITLNEATIASATAVVRAEVATWTGADVGPPVDLLLRLAHVDRQGADDE
jgi:pyrroloquinoline quinone (PQQ) biosynthesis protein C